MKDVTLTSFVTLDVTTLSLSRSQEFPPLCHVGRDKTLFVTLVAHGMPIAVSGLLSRPTMKRDKT